MRIVCQKCAAAYAIDDRVITPKGVRAQCPRCRHLQLVKREDASAQPAASSTATTPAPKPAAAPKPVAAAKPTTPASIPMTPPRPLSSDDLFGDLGDLEPAPDPNDAPSDSLLSDLSAIGKSSASSSATSNDSLFGDLADLTQSSQSNPVVAAPKAVAVPLPSPAAPAPKPAAPAPKPAAPVQSKPAAPAPKPPPPVQSKPAAPAPLPEPEDDGLFDFNAPPGFSAPPQQAAPAPKPPAPKPAAPAPKPPPPVQSKPPPPVQSKPAEPAPLPEPEDDGLFDFNAPPGFSAPPQQAAPAPKPPAPAPKPAAPAPRSPAPAPAPAAEAFPELADDGMFDFNAPPGFNAPSQAAAPAPADAAADPLLDFFGAPASSPQPAPTPAKAPAKAPAPDAAPKTCRECGKQLVDPFDEALGSCEDCRQRDKQPTSTPAPAAARSVEVLDLPPMPGAASLPPEANSAAGRSAPDAPALETESRSAVRPAAQRPPAKSGVARSSGGGGRGALMGALVLLLVVGGGGAAYLFVPEVKALVGGTQGGGVSSGPSNQPAAGSSSLPSAVESVLPRWQLMFVDANGGDSKQLVSEGQSLLAKDQRVAYSQAAESFQRALLADPRNDEAIGGYVQALALGYGSRLDEASFQEARGLIEAARARAQQRPDLLVAHANLLLARPSQTGNVDEARKLAETVLADSRDGAVPQKAEAHLVLGRVYLTSSRELANQHFESALAIAPDLQRVQYYRALADENSGDYTQAIERLRKRLEQHPDHWESRSTLARIFLEVGDVEQARQLYEARLKSTPGDFHALLSLAVLRYQVEGGVAGGLGALRGLLRNREKYDEREVAELLLHVAAAERSAKNLDAAAKAAREALSLVKQNPEANLQLFLIALARKDSSAAAGHLATLRGQLEDPVLEKMLEGRLRLLERKPSEAMALFMEASKLDSRRMDALLLAGVAAAQDKRRDEAIRVFSQVLQADPMRLAPRPVVTTFYLRPGELLDGLEGSIVAMAQHDDDMLPHLYEGLLRFHQGEAAAAEKMFKKVADVDANNAPALAYRAFIALGRKDMKAAKVLAGQAVDGGRREALAHLAQGLVLSADPKQLEGARRALREAVTLSPKQYAAEVKLAELEAASSADSVRARMVRLLGLDPTYLPAKRILYLLDKRG